MYVAAVVTLVCGGAGLSWAAASRPAMAARLECAGGALLIAGLAVLGLALPAAHHLSPG